MEERNSFNLGDDLLGVRINLEVDLPTALMLAAAIFLALVGALAVYAKALR